MIIRPDTKLSVAVKLLEPYSRVFGYNLKRIDELLRAARKYNEDQN